MKKMEFVKNISEYFGISNFDANLVYEEFMTVLTEAVLNGEEVILPGFGKFSLRDVKEREYSIGGKGRVVSAHKRLHFTASTSMKKALRGEE